MSDAKSVLDIVEGSYSSIMDNLLEMKGLATQAANDTLSHSERRLIATQIQGLATDINGVATSTTCNGMALNPTSDTTLTYFLVGEGTTDTYDVTARKISNLYLVMLVLHKI